MYAFRIQMNNIIYFWKIKTYDPFREINIFYFSSILFSINIIITKEVLPYTKLNILILVEICMYFEFQWP